MYIYETVTQAIAHLKERGYVLDFNLAFDQLRCEANGVCLSPAAFEITETYRFEGDTNPSDEDVVYAIAAKDGSYKGVLSSAYGMYADALSTDMLQKISASHRR